MAKLREYYTNRVTTMTPGLILFLVDVSASMDRKFGDKTGIDIANAILEDILVTAIQRCVFGNGLIKNNYNIGLFVYSDDLYPVFSDFVKPISDVAKIGVPKLETRFISDTVKAFQSFNVMVNDLISSLPDESPAPIIFHISDDGYNLRRFPRYTISKIMKNQIKDGKILFSNVVINHASTIFSKEKINSWAGVRNQQKDLPLSCWNFFEVSSVMPNSMRIKINEYGYNIKNNARLFFPHTYSQIAKLCIPYPIIS